MANFTTINSTADLTHVDLLNELVGGLSERRRAAGGAAWPAVSKGDDIQAATFWSLMQAAIELICTSFVDHTAGVGAAAYDGETSLPMFTLSSFRTAAGLPSSGFRRATSWDTAVNVWTNNNDPMYSYGYMQADGQADDIIGPWIWVDLQKALDALRWTTVSPGLSYSTLQSRTSGYSSWYAVCADATAEQGTDWAASSWGLGLYYFYVAAGLLEQSGANYRALGSRQKCLPGGNVGTVVPCAIDVYFGIDSASGYTFDDVDSLGAQEGKLCYHENWAAITPAQASRGGAGEATWFGAYDTNPLTAAGISCPTAAHKAVYSSAMHWVCKWAFSHTL